MRSKKFGFIDECLYRKIVGDEGKINPLVYGNELHFSALFEIELWEYDDAEISRAIFDWFLELPIKRYALVSFFPVDRSLFKDGLPGEEYTWIFENTKKDVGFINDCSEDYLFPGMRLVFDSNLEIIINVNTHREFVEVSVCNKDNLLSLINNNKQFHISNDFNYTV